ncbi:hypothetical protein [Fictibacillus phosphorivorans]|uniref:hypothetical protein n=1 Tax=Fictibacillus phosphorivorans TaxID=1221500 RepID=UPI001293F1DF|nr:hypothetical protein [Fictibacillus phosphorivorans]MQR94531.1 hypothetical protein [Fictibacillus phosphorivorans]
MLLEIGNGQINEGIGQIMNGIGQIKCLNGQISFEIGQIILSIGQISSKLSLQIPLKQKKTRYYPVVVPFSNDSTLYLLLDLKHITIRLHTHPEYNTH